MKLENIVRNKWFYIVNIFISIYLIISSFSYTGYKFYILFIICSLNIVLTILNMYKRGILTWKKNR